MKFTLAAVVAGLAALVDARAALTNSVYNVVADQPFKLEWTGATGAVTISLNKLETGEVFQVYKELATGLTGTSLEVTLSASDLASGSNTYAFSIKDQSSDPVNYGGRFTLSGSGSSSSSTSGSVTSTTSTSTSHSTTTSVSTTTSASTSSSTNSTATTTTTSSSRSSSSPAGTTGPSSSPPSNLNAGGKLQSSLALALVGVAAFVFLN